MPDNVQNGRPLIFGEVLYDAFPDGSEVLGGAPFNVAWHLQGFGLRPLLISRIGRDARGAEIIDTMRGWGMDVAGMQQDDRHSTGSVSVTLNGGQPYFEIVPDQAWDHIESLPALSAASDCAVALIYHGTLALRSTPSQGALRELRKRIAAPACIDVNLRPPWWDRNILADLLHRAGWAKLNDAELETLVGETLADQEDLECAGAVLRRHHEIETLVITRGASGALIMTGDGVFHGAPEPVERLVDTVGAGDAFSAIALLGMLQGWPAAVTLTRALRFASDVCGMRGATAPDRSLYERHTEHWDGLR
jgi:fructokinase